MIRHSASVCIDADASEVWERLARLEDIQLWSEAGAVANVGWPAAQFVADQPSRPYCAGDNPLCRANVRGSHCGAACPPRRGRPVTRRRCARAAGGLHGARRVRVRRARRRFGPPDRGGWWGRGRHVARAGPRRTGRRGRSDCRHLHRRRGRGPLRDLGESGSLGRGGFNGGGGAGATAGGGGGASDVRTCSRVWRCPGGDSLIRASSSRPAAVEPAVREATMARNVPAAPAGRRAKTGSRPRLRRFRRVRAIPAVGRATPAAVTAAAASPATMVPPGDFGRGGSGGGAERGGGGGGGGWYGGGGGAARAGLRGLPRRRGRRRRLAGVAAAAASVSSLGHRLGARHSTEGHDHAEPSRRSCGAARE